MVARVVQKIAVVLWCLQLNFRPGQFNVCCLGVFVNVLQVKKICVGLGTYQLECSLNFFNNDKNVGDCEPPPSLEVS